MFVLMSQCAEDFVEFFLKDDSKVIEVDVTDALSRYANDVIATTAFGVKCDSLKDRNNEFYFMGNEAANVFKGIRGTVTMIIFMMFPKIAKVFKRRINFIDRIIGFVSFLECVYLARKW